MKKKAAPLPDWDAVAKKPAEPAKKPKVKKPAATKQPEPTPALEPTLEPTPKPTPEPAPEPTPEPTPEPEPAVAAPPEPVPAEPEPGPPVLTAPREFGPDEPSARALERRKFAERTARGEIIVGGVLTVLGLGGVGAMTAGLLQKGEAEDSGDADRLARNGTTIAAGAVSGAFGLALGLALLVDGVRDLKAARPGRSAQVRVAPTFGGLVLSGRF